MAADYNVSSYFHDAQGIYVNLYLPSVVRWDGVTLTQQTDYPVSPRMRIAVALVRPRHFAIRLRIPGWATSGTTMLINGHPAGVSVQPGRFAAIDRIWSSGDTVELTFAMPLRLEAVDAQTPDRVALMRGPLALFQSGEQLVPFRRTELTGARQVGDTAAWTVATDSGPKAFLPFAAVPPATPTRLYQAVV
ncbi:hypothetical protein ACU5AX_14695 [Sphingomonas sp. XXL09]|uniref:hypothetical protein n=1 Tax=Sphingomonas sp. XXL09 TaxID=3457787 RepID=UPI00406BCD1A